MLDVRLILTDEASVGLYENLVSACLQINALRHLLATAFGRFEVMTHVRLTVRWKKKQKTKQKQNKKL